MVVERAFQIISRDSKNPIPPRSALFPKPIGKYTPLNINTCKRPNLKCKHSTKMLKNIESRLFKYKQRLVRHNMTSSLYDVFKPTIARSPLRSQLIICKMLFTLIPHNASFENDPPNTHASKKQVMELDHVIPLSWIWTHKQYFKSRPKHVNLLLGWYNIMPLPHCINRQKANYTPNLDDINVNIKNKRLYLKTFVRKYHKTTLLQMEKEYRKIYAEIIKYIETQKI